uniref:Uncharacterized protein n=1 Tax=Sphaerodactylus townsendi TaxID=933632 RepID=A0ACB8FV27_9SAUR
MAQLAREPLRKGGLEPSFKTTRGTDMEASQQDVLEDLEQPRSEKSQLAREPLRKGVLEPSFKSIRGTDLEESRQDVMDDLDGSSPEVTEFPHKHLKKEWLEASIANLRSRDAEASSQNVQKWLQACMSTIQESPKTDKQNLKGWLEAPIKNLPAEFSEAPRKDVKEWVEVSKSYLEKKDPDISTLNVGEWLHESMCGIQELQRPEGSKDALQVGEREPSIIAVHKSLESTNLLEHGQEPSTGSVHEWYRSNLTEEPSTTSKQDVEKSLHLSSEDEKRKASPKSVKEWLSASGRKPEVKRLETPRQSAAAEGQKSVRGLQAKRPGTSTVHAKDWLKIPMPNVKKGASRLKVQEWLDSSMRSLEEAGPEVSKLSLQEWLEESLRTLGKKLPEESRHDVQEYLEACLSTLPKPTASMLSVHQWIEANLKRLKEEGPDESAGDVEECLEAYVKEEASQPSVEEWLSLSLRKLHVEDPKSSRADVKEWLETSLRRLEEPKQNLQEYIKESIMTLRPGSLLASRSRSSMGSIQVPKTSMRAGDYGRILKQGSSKVSFDVSNIRRISAEDDVELDQGIAPETSEIMITFEAPKGFLQAIRTKGTCSCKKVASSTKWLISCISNTVYQYRTFLKLFIIYPIILFILTVIVILALALLYTHCKQRCKDRGLVPF